MHSFFNFFLKLSCNFENSDFQNWTLVNSSFIRDPPIKCQFQPTNDQCFPHIEISQLTCLANQLTGFYMMGKLLVNFFKKKQFCASIIDLFFYLFFFLLHKIFAFYEVKIYIRTFFTLFCGPKKYFMKTFTTIVEL